MQGLRFACRSLWLIAALFAGLMGIAAAEDSPAIRALMEASGLDIAFAPTGPALIATGTAAHGFGPQAARDWESAATAHFALAVANDELAARFGFLVAGADLPALVQYFSTDPLAMRLVAREADVAMAGPDARRSLVKQGRRLLDTADENRRALYAALHEETHQPVLLAGITHANEITAIAHVMARIPPDTPKRRSYAEQMITALRIDYAIAIARETEALDAYVYDGFSIAELEILLAFARSEDGQRFWHAAAMGLGDAAIARAMAFAADVEHRIAGPGGKG